MLVSRDIWKIPPIDGFLLLHIKNFEWAINYPECREKSFPSTATRFFEVDVHIVCLLLFLMLYPSSALHGLTWKKSHPKASGLENPPDYVGPASNKCAKCSSSQTIPVEPTNHPQVLHSPPLIWSLSLVNQLSTFSWYPTTAVQSITSSWNAANTDNVDMSTMHCSWRFAPARNSRSFQGFTLNWQLLDRNATSLPQKSLESAGNLKLVRISRTLSRRFISFKSGQQLKWNCRAG